MQLILLSAGRGSRLSKKLRKKPKCLATVGKKSILEHNLDFFKKFKNKIIVTGYKKNLLKSFAKKNNFKIIYNNKFQSTNMVHSMFLASKLIKEDVVVCYGDIIFDKSVYFMLRQKENIMPLNSQWLKIWKKRMNLKMIKNDAENIVVKKNYIFSIGEQIKYRYPKFQYMGLFKLKKKTFFELKKFFVNINNKSIDMTNFLNKSIKEKNLKFKVRNYKKYWFEIDSLNDVKVATKELDSIEKKQI